QPRRLVEHEHLGILVQHLQRDVLRLGADLVLELRAQADRLAATDRIARPRPRTVEQGVAGLDPFSQPRAREFREQFGQHGVEAPAGGGLGDDGFTQGAGRGSGLGFRCRHDCYYPGFVFPAPAKSPMTPRQTPRPALRPVLLLLLAAVLVLPGCSTIKGLFKDQDANEGVPVSELYDKGHDQMVHGNWTSAITVFKRLVAQYPYGPYTEQALMEIAYAQFKSGRNEEAISS